MNHLVVLLMSLIAQLTTPRPNAGTPADPAQAMRPRRYVGRHAASRKDHQ